MIYLVDKDTYNVVGVLVDTDNYDTSNFITVESNIEAPLHELKYDAETNTIYQITSDDILELARDTKLDELKSQIQARFSIFGDVIADIVKGIKLIIKLILTTDDTVKADLTDYLNSILSQLEQLYPDDYCKQCLQHYLNELLEDLPKYYNAKQAVLNATTEDEIWSVELEE